MMAKYDLAEFAAINARAYREYMARHPDQQRISLTREQLEAICRDLEDYAAVRERLAIITEAVQMERTTLNDAFDADAWIGYATPLASVERIAAALAEKGDGDA